MKSLTTPASALFLTTAVPLPAATFDTAGVSVAGSAPVARILNCDLIKTFVYDQGREDPAYVSVDADALD